MVLSVLVAGCPAFVGCDGSSRSADAACAGGPHPASTREVQISIPPDLTKRRACAVLGKPRQVINDGRGQIRWVYGPKDAMTFAGDTAVSLTLGGRTTEVPHGPASCAQASAQLDASIRRVLAQRGAPVIGGRRALERDLRLLRAHPTTGCVVMGSAFTFRR